MTTLKWRFKSRIETFLNKSKLFDNLISKSLKKISEDNVFFVVIGANDGVSNDILFPFVQKNNWQGVYIEPQRNVFEQLKINLKHKNNLFFENIAITKEESEFLIYIPKDKNIKDYSGIASINRNGGVLNRFKDEELLIEKVIGKPFQYLIDKYSLINRDNLIIVIDVEGEEKNIIFSLDFLQINPRIIIFEHAHMTYDEHRHVNSWMVKNGYKIYVDKFDTFCYKQKRLPPKRQPFFNRCTKII